MLSREENCWNFRCLKILARWNFLPISVDEKSGRISRQRKKSKLTLWYFFFGLELLHLFYGFIRLVQLLLSPDVKSKMDHVLIHSMVITYFPIIFWGYQLCIKHQRESILLFNQLFSHEKYNSKNKVAPRKILTWDLKYNRHELITLMTPFAMFGAALLLIPIFLSDPNRMMILYSSVPTDSKFQHWSIFLLLTSVDVFFLCRKLAYAVFSFLTQLLFFQKCQVTFNAFQQNFRNSIEMPRANSIQNLLREMQNHFLYVHLFNRAFAFVIFTYKQLALFYAIFTGFFTIRYNFEYPFTAIFAAYCHAVIVLIYSIMFEKAFTIPENWRKVKGHLRVSAILSTIKQYPNPNSNDGGGKAGLFQKEIQRIPEIGVKVGDFHVLERESTPNFLMFVVSSVSSLLITFR